ncbi:MAG TPA: cytochrome b5 domain-containing protein [Polyangiales bacterium]|nr:cytochrome b5 domain-containing protein [Polyangiales bacterium]
MKNDFAGPAERVIRLVEAHNRRVGHENLGFLSAARGFVPLHAPLLQLSAPFAAWDELAAELPELWRNVALRRRVSQLPLLDASPASLPDRELLRACALLAIVSHAYWHCECEPPPSLPDALSVPWAQLRARLRRTQEALSYVDLIVYNWRTSNPCSTLSLEELELLLPIAGDQEERVFYLTQLEILARAAPLPALLASAQSAALREDHAALETLLSRIARVFSHSASALARIDPRAHAPTHVDPVRWAKQVAPLAVPFRRGQLGPSGTSSPLFNTLDAFFGRSQWQSQLGQEIRALRRTYPTAWQLFLRALDHAPLSELVARSPSSAVHDAWQHALSLYTGPDGFLARHRRKVYGYLEIAFKVGRSLTIGGFGGAFVDRTWDEVDGALGSAHSERPSAPARTVDPLPAAAGSPRPIDVSEVATRNSAARGYWLIVEGVVYDVSRFVANHPGGHSVLRAYAGLDASAGFARAHASNSPAQRVREALRIGEVRQLDLGTGPELRAAYRASTVVLQLLVEMQNAFALDCAFTRSHTPYERLRALERHQRFLGEYVAVLERMLPELWSRLFPDARANELKTLLQGIRTHPSALDVREQARRALAAFHPGRETACDDLDARDAGLLEELKSCAITIVRAYETHAPALEGRGTRRIRRACLSFAGVLRRYYRT